MVVTVVSFKGGVGKTTTAVHLAAFLQKKGDTLLVDGDPNRSASGWAKRGGFPFAVQGIEQVNSRNAPQFTHVVIDTEARPTRDGLVALSQECDLLVIPSTPDVLALDALMQTLDVLNGKFRILLTIVPPKPSTAGDQVRTMLRKAGWPVFKTAVRRLAAFQKAAMLGRLVQDVPDPRAPLGWADYEAVGKEMK